MEQTPAEMRTELHTSVGAVSTTPGREPGGESKLGVEDAAPLASPMLDVKSSDGACKEEVQHWGWQRHLEGVSDRISDVKVADGASEVRRQTPEGVQRCASAMTAEKERRRRKRWHSDLKITANEHDVKSGGEVQELLEDSEGRSAERELLQHGAPALRSVQCEPSAEEDNRLPCRVAG